jgi:hypothetical protein
LIRAWTSSRPASVGPDMTRSITSLHNCLHTEKLAEKPLSGGISALHLDVPDVYTAAFKG